MIREDKQKELDLRAQQENSSEDQESSNSQTDETHDRHKQFEQQILAMLMNMNSNESTMQREIDEQREKEMLERAIQESLMENPNPDVMNYEQLQELQDKIGVVSKGFSDYEISKIPCKMNTSTKEDCSICLEKIKIAEKIKTLSCGHEFHKDCIDQCMKTTKKCPCCMSEHQIIS
jgi:hypothetical protein